MFMVQVVYADEAYWEYTFRPGDSLWAIAQKYTTSVDNWRDIQQINKIQRGITKKIPIGSRILIPVSMLKVQPVPARVVASSEAVTLFRANGAQTVITVGTLLYSGDKVITGKNQTVRLQFADGSQLQIASQSEVLIDKLSLYKESGMLDTQIRLNSGRINTQVKKQKNNSRYEVITPSAITAVRGTAFRVASIDATRSKIEVIEGVVDVIVGDDKKPVKKGFGMVVEKGKQLTEPIRLLAPPQVQIVAKPQSSSIKILWQKLKEAEAYSYQLAKNSEFSQLVQNSTTQDRAVELNHLASGHYYFRVRGIDKFKLQGHESIQDFIIENKKQNNGLLEKAILPSQIYLLN